MNALLLDTGVIVALLDRREEHHRQCNELVMSTEALMITCEAVITEACFLLRRVPGAADDVLDNVERGEFQIPAQLTPRVKSVRRLMKKYADTPMDFADACLVDLANEAGTGRILTLDRDFQVYRWGRNRAFELLVDLE
ncbi:Ribonuclease VapC26 [Pseudobythopirellula maris]|uniref:Ribonuclease VapC n=1 Tax=Pseudobythopirellula maris TaxID=2527991 RepID=A0A5C5ZVD8_9BACT|nr:PIN domain-containing protein [Pseudobythopirellula maris]TWT90967.1 Ribonuclease VapC26 [Pseudobythopirellula maris]